MRHLIFLMLFVPSVSAATIKVAIIDSGIKRTEIKAQFCPESKDFQDGRDDEDQTHGTIVAKVLSEGLENLDYCIMDLRVFNDSKGTNYDVTQAIRHATKHGAAIINLSLSGPLPSVFERLAIEDAVSKNITLFVAAGNEAQNLNIKCNSYPACYNLDKIIVVGDNCTNVSNYGSIVRIIACSRAEYKDTYNYGTSFSTPKIVNLFLKTLKDIKK